MKRRPSQGVTRRAQGSAGELSALRAQYTDMDPSHPEFDTVFEHAEATAAVLEGALRTMGRPGGLSRRAAGERFLAAHAILGDSREALPSADNPGRDYDQTILGAAAMTEFGFEPSGEEWAA